MNSEHGKIILYHSTKGISSIDVHLKDETVWLTQTQMMELFQRDQSVISRYVNNVFKEGELSKASNMQKMHIANSDKPVAFYNLFILFLQVNKMLDQQNFDNKGLVALTLLIAASDPVQKDLLVRLIMNLLSGVE